MTRTNTNPAFIYYFLNKHFEHQGTARLACASHHTFANQFENVQWGLLQLFFWFCISEEMWKNICSDPHQVPNLNLRFNDAKAISMRFNFITDYGRHWTHSFAGRPKNVSGQHLPLAGFVSFALIKFYKTSWYYQFDIGHQKQSFCRKFKFCLFVFFKWILISIIFQLLWRR